MAKAKAAAAGWVAAVVRAAATVTVAAAATATAAATAMAAVAATATAAAMGWTPNWEAAETAAMEGTRCRSPDTALGSCRW